MSIRATPGGGGYANGDTYTLGERIDISLPGASGDVVLEVLSSGGEFQGGQTVSVLFFGGAPSHLLTHLDAFRAAATRARWSAATPAPPSHSRPAATSRSAP